MSDQRRFEAAKAAMQALLPHSKDCARPIAMVAQFAVAQADALLAELAKPCRGPDQAAPQGSAPDALLLARLEAAERVCKGLGCIDYVGTGFKELIHGWIKAKAAHLASLVQEEQR